MLHKLIVEVFSVLSRAVNVAAGGDADMTFSARAYRDGMRKTERAINLVFLIVFREADHCKVWWLHEVARSRATIEQAEILDQSLKGNPNG